MNWQKWIVFLIACLTCASVWADEYYWSMGRKRHLTLQTDLVLVRITRPHGLNSSPASQNADSEAFPAEYAHLADSCRLLRNNSSISSVVPAGDSQVLPVYTDRDGRYVFPTGELIVKARNGSPEKHIDSLLQVYSLTVLRRDYPLPGMMLCAIPYNAYTGIFQTANRLHENPDIEWAYPNFIQPFYRRGTVNDPLFTTQWHLTNDGHLAGATAGADAKVADAWDSTMGTGCVRICIYDDSVQKDHEDLAANYVAGLNLEDLGSDPSPRIFSGPNAEMHGTACAGVAVSRGNNGIGCSGAAPLCSLMGIRWGAADSAQTAFGFYWARTNGADIISCSWGTYMDSALYDAIHDAALNGRVGKGCVILFAAGNDDAPIPVWDPSRHPDVICVVASNCKDQRASYSSYGSAASIASPSDDMSKGLLGITTTDDTGINGYSPDNYCHADNDTGFGGTSSATPLAAGVAALCLSVETNLTRENVKALLQETADKIDTVNYPYANGWSQYLGYGRINADRAVLTAPGYTNTPIERKITFTGAKGKINEGKGRIKAKLSQIEPPPAGFYETALVRLNGTIIAQFGKGGWKWNSKGTKGKNKTVTGDMLKLGGKPGKYYTLFKASHLMLAPLSQDVIFELVLETESQGTITLHLDPNGRFSQ